MKIVINTCFGSFSLSKAAYVKLNMPWDGHEYDFNDDRANPQLIAVVEDLGDSAAGWCASLSIVEIPDNVEWQIEEHNGREWISEKHRTRKVRSSAVRLA